MRDIFKTTPLTPPEKSSLLMWHGGYQGGRVFHNDGTDYVESDNPTVIAGIQPMSEYTVEIELISNTTPSTYYSILSTDSRMLLIGHNAVTDSYSVVIGNSTNAFSIPRPPNGVITQIAVEATATNVTLIVNGISEIKSSIGTTVATSNKLYFNSNNGGYLNYQGDLIRVTFYSGIGASKSLLDSYNFTDPNQWDGGASGTSLNGNTFTVTDGTPTDSGDYAYSKELFSDNYAMYQYSTGNINPNPTGDATLTGLGFTNSYMTKASLSALHNGTTIFVSDASATLFRMLVYSSLTDTQKALDYVRR